MRSVVLLVTLALACGGEPDAAPAARPATPLSEAIVAEVVPDALRARLGGLVPAAPVCGAIPAGLTTRLDATRAAPSATGTAQLSTALADAAASLEATPPADPDLAAAVRELGASLRDLAAAFDALAGAIGRGDAAAARALGPRIDNGVGNAEVSVAKVLQRCGA
jgi:hypothetical protein